MNKQPWYDKAVGWFLSVPGLLACLALLAGVAWMATP